MRKSFRVASSSRIVRAAKSSSRALRLEQLEPRQMLAGGSLAAVQAHSLPTPAVQFINNPIAVGDYLPGAQNVLLADETVKVVDHQYERLDELLLLSAYAQAGSYPGRRG